MRVLRRNWIVPVLLASMVGLLVMACGGHSRSLPPATPSTPTVTDGAVEGALPSGQMGTELPPTAGIPLNWHKGPSACFGELSLTAYYPEGRNPQSYLRGLRLVPRGEETGCYDLVATGDLEKRRALLFEVGYPEGLMHPVEVSFAPRYQDAAALTFTTLDAEGVLPLGVIKLDVITEPPAGESVIATVRFACGATYHSASKVPTGPLNKVELHAGTSEGATIAWDERNCADTNNDGVVSIADITPIAAYFTQSASASAGAEMADTNKDTVVSIADLTNIAAFYGAELAGYAIYRDISERRRAEEALEESEKRYKKLFEASPNGIVITKLDGRIIEASQSFQEMLGYTLEELKEMNFQQFTPAKWHRAEAEILKSFFNRGYGSFEKEYIRKDGTISPILLTGWLIRNKQGILWA